MGVGPSLPWGRASPETVQRQFLIPAGVGIAVVVVLSRAPGCAGAHAARSPSASPASSRSSPCASCSCRVRLRMREQARSRSPARSGGRATRARRRFGGYVVHLGRRADLRRHRRLPVLRVARHRDPEARRAVPARTPTRCASGLRNGVDPHRRWTAADVRYDRRQRPAARPRAADELLRAEHRPGREPCHPLGRVRGPLPDAPGLRSGRPVRQLQRLDLPDGLRGSGGACPSSCSARCSPRGRSAGAPGPMPASASSVPSKARSPGAAA